jgi:hypothetical protein
VIAANPIVDWNALGQVVLYSLGVGVGVMLCYALAILGATRFAELRAGDRTGGALAYAVLGVLGFAATIAAVVGAIIVMTNKS